MAMIHLVRHGQAAAGFGTHKDPGLDDSGRQQAIAVAAMLEPLGPMPIWSSPLARAFETAEPLAARAQWLAQAMQGNWRDLAEEFQSWRDSLVACLLQIDHDCVMFSHYVAINAAVGAAQQDPRMRVFAPDNCSVTGLNNSGGVLTVETLGRTADTRIN